MRRCCSRGSDWVQHQRGQLYDSVVVIKAEKASSVRLVLTRLPIICSRVSKLVTQMSCFLLLYVVLWVLLKLSIYFNLYSTSLCFAGRFKQSTQIRNKIDQRSKTHVSIQNCFIFFLQAEMWPNQYRFLFSWIFSYLQWNLSLEAHLQLWHF